MHSMAGENGFMRKKRKEDSRIYQWHSGIELFFIFTNLP